MTIPLPVTQCGLKAVHELFAEWVVYVFIHVSGELASRSEREKELAAGNTVW